MIFKITQIEFDFDDAIYEDVTEEEQNEIINDTTSYLWDSPTEEELVDIISDNTGWTVINLQYEKV
jgi:hypothetical protein